MLIDGYYLNLWYLVSQSVSRALYGYVDLTGYIFKINFEWDLARDHINILLKNNFHSKYRPRPTCYMRCT